jgi:hypothetical protein
VIRPLANLSFALIATLAAPEARAVHRDPQGMGQVLIFPYFTVNAGHSTLLSVVNSSDDTKAIKLRLREALKGRAVLDINLYLGARDVYTAAVVADGVDGPVRLLSTDTSCTLSVGDVTGTATSYELRYDGPDDGRPGLQRTREGWIEVIEMGVLADTNGDDSLDASTSFADAVTHVAGRPAGCERVATAWSGGPWSLGTTRAAVGDSVGVTPPRGGLHGSAALIDVAQGVSYAFDADAIDGFFGLAETTLHTPPGSDAPDLASAETTPGRARAIVVDRGRLLELDFEAGRPDAVSAVLMAEVLHNEYGISTALAAGSEWIVTFPTRHLHERHADARRRPFAEPGTDCEPFHARFYDRELGPASYPWHDDHSPRRHPDFCHHVQVVAWGVDVASQGPTPLLGSRLPPDFGRWTDTRLLLDGSRRPVETGHAVLVPAVWASSGGGFLLDGHENAGQAPRHRLHGLPMTGLWLANYQNAAARPGLLANYSTTSRHRVRVRADAVLVTGEGTPGETIRPVPGR